MKSLWYYEYSIGTIGIMEDDIGISQIFVKTPSFSPNATDASSLTNLCAQQLEEYFAGTRHHFSIPISLHGSPFQLTVWNALCHIPYGETRTYKQIAEQIGKPGASRAVGQANSANPVAFIIPCHRVIPTNGSIGGYAYGSKLKRFLLQLECLNT